MKQLNCLQPTRRLLLAAMLVLMFAGYVFGELNEPPEGFVALFNGKNLDGWWGAKTEDPRGYMTLSPDELAEKKAASMEDVREHWRAEDGVLINDGRGLFLTTDKFHGDFELLASYRMAPSADSGIYLRGTPQVSIWDVTDEDKFKHGADKGSGGLWNNPPGASGKDPLVKADSPVGEWNEMRVIMTGERVSVWLNGQHVVDHARLHNYYDKGKPEAERRPLPQKGPIQLQTHGGEMRWRNLFIREIGHEEANRILGSHDNESFQSAFNGKNLAGWSGDTQSYTVSDGALTCKPGKGGTVHTEEEYADFAVRLQFNLPPGGNNGLAMRYPGEGHGTWNSFCELQVLDDDHPRYNDPDHPQYYDLKPQQAHGAVYARAAPCQGYLRSGKQWNFQESTIDGTKVKVELNGFLILETDVSELDPETFMYPVERFVGRANMKGYFGFNGHNDPVQFRAIRIKTLD